MYILANKRNGTIYVGVTSHLVKRVYEHKNSVTKGFTSKFNCNKLVYFEFHADMQGAILREKQLKSGSRTKKLDLIESINPTWKDLYHDIIE